MIKIIVGDVPTLKDGALARIRKECDDATPEQFYGPEARAKAIHEACSTLSLLGDKNFVIVRSADKLPRKEQEALRSILPGLSAEATLVLMADKVDRRLKFWQHILKISDVISVGPPSTRERRSYLQQEVRRRGLQWDADAFQVLVELGQADFNQAMLLLDKVELFLGDKKRVSRELIETCASGTSPSQIFAWAEAVGAGDWKRAFTLLQTLWSHQAEPLAILALLIRHFRLLLKAVENKSLWGQRNELARVLGVPIFAVDRYSQQASRYKRHDLIGLWQELLAADRGLKSSPGKKEWVLEQLLWRLRGMTSEAS